MKLLRVVDEAGNGQDYETEFVPRIGERIVLEYRTGGEPLVTHYFRVKDVEYHLDHTDDNQVRILTEEEHDAEPWPN